MDGFVRTGDLASGQRMLQDMQACGLKPNTITFNILLRGICQCLDRPVEVCDLIFLSLHPGDIQEVFPVEVLLLLDWQSWRGMVHRHTALLKRGRSITKYPKSCRML